MCSPCEFLICLTAANCRWAPTKDNGGSWAGCNQHHQVLVGAVRVGGGLGAGKVKTTGKHYLSITAKKNRLGCHLSGPKYHAFCVELYETCAMLLSVLVHLRTHKRTTIHAVCKTAAVIVAVAKTRVPRRSAFVRHDLTQKRGKPMLQCTILLRVRVHGTEIKHTRYKQ